MKNPEFKKHALTEVPGGYTMLLEFSDGTKTNMPRVKYPVKYVDKVATEARIKGVTLMRATVVERNKVIYEVK